MRTYYFDPQQRRWFVARWLGGSGAHLRDLEVHEAPGVTRTIEAMPFHPKRGGWSDVQPNDPRLEACLALVPEQDPEEEAAPVAEPARAPTVPAPAEIDPEALVVDPQALTVDELEDALDELTKEHQGNDALLVELGYIRQREVEGKNRKTALEVIDATANELGSGGSDEEE